jgi:hypothetical protein
MEKCVDEVFTFIGTTSIGLVLVSVHNWVVAGKFYKLLVKFVLFKKLYFLISILD